MSKQQLVSVLWGDEDTRKKPCTQQVLNQSTAHAAETEQSSLPAPTEEALPEPTAPTTETPKTEEPQAEENTKCSVCLQYTKNTRCSVKHKYCELRAKDSNDHEENMVFDTYYNQWLPVHHEYGNAHYEDINNYRQKIRAFSLSDVHVNLHYQFIKMHV